MTFVGATTPWKNPPPRAHFFPHRGKKFSTLWKKTGQNVPHNGKTFCDFSTQWNNFGENVPQCGKILIPRWRDFPRCGILSHNSPRPARTAGGVTNPLLFAVRSTCMWRISCGFWRGCRAKITDRFSDDGALRTTRAGLVSASGRARRASAEKMPVGFGAAKFCKKSSIPSVGRSKAHEPTAPAPTEAGYKKNISHSPDDGTETASPKTRMEN